MNRNDILKIKLSLIFLLLFLGVAEWVYTGNSYNFDWNIYGNICKIRNDFLTVFMMFMTYFGDVVAVIVVAISSVFVAYRLKCKNYCMEILFLSGFQHLCNRILKSIFKRPRISEVALVYETSYSFPSGHTMTAVVLWGFIAYLIYKSKYKKYVFIPLVSSVLTALSRIYLGAHYFTDVLGAALIAVPILIFGIMFIEKTNK